MKHPGPQKLSTDDKYKHRWIEWYFWDGSMLDSRNVNWRHIHWEKIVRMKMRIREHEWEVDNKDPRFRYFLCFRKEITGPVYRHGVFTGRNKDQRWVMGWSDGETAHLRDFCFQTGELVREYEHPMSRIPGQIHPRVGGNVVPDVAEA